MSHDNDPFWDDLKITWHASVRDAGLTSSRLEMRLKLQSALLTVGTLTAAAVSLASFGLAAWALWIGSTSGTWNFIARGITLAAVSVLAGMASLTLRAHNRVATGSLREMMQVSIARIKSLIRAADLACVSLVILAVGGMIGYALRIKFGHPPAVSPVEDLLALALAGLALVWFRRHQAHTLRRFRHIQRVFDSADELQ